VNTPISGRHFVTPRWHTVIFDLDGTLINTIDLIVSSYQYAFRTVLGHEYPEAEIRSWIGKSLRESLTNTCPDKGEDLFAAYIEWNQAHLATMADPYPGIPELLTELHEFKVQTGIASSKRFRSAQETLEVVGLEGVVPLLVTHDDVVDHKPHPAPLLLAAKKLECPVEETVYIGDALVDVQAAQAAGMDSIAVTWGAGVREELVDAGPTILVDTVAELRDILLGTVSHTPRQKFTS
jgi:pyrophosphatase PpaX